MPEFGHGEVVYNVIDSRQSYLQDVVVAGLRALGYSAAADASIAVPNPANASIGSVPLAASVVATTPTPSAAVSRDEAISADASEPAAGDATSPSTHDIPPTALAIRMAKEAGVTLIAIARGDAFQVFAHPERLEAIAAADPEIREKLENA